MSDYTDYVNDYMNSYKCPDCNDAKLQSDKVARKVNEVIEQVNQIIDNDIATTEYLLEKADEIVGDVAQVKVNRIIDDLNAEVDKKANKNEVFSMANMGQDVKEAMTGGSVAVVGVNAILNENIVDGQVSPTKTSFCILENNPNYAAENLLENIVYEAGKLRQGNGGTVDYSTYDCTPLIPVNEACDYSLNVKYVNFQYYLYDSDGKNGTVTQVGAVDKQTELKITIPKSKKFIAFNCMNTSSYNKPQSFYRITQLENEKNIIIPNLIVKKPIKLNRNGNNIIVEYKLKDNKLINIELKNHGTNNLFDFSKIDIIENNIITNYSTIKTDIHSPFVIKSLNNADGDNQKSSFTGGNHGYDGNTGGGATARPIALEMYADGETVKDGISYCNNLTLKWTNRVQAWNTKKADGSGREVLEETHTITFSGKKWYTETELTFLENCKITTCYGLQYFFDRTRTQIEYIGGNNRIINEATVSSNCGVNKPNGIKIIDKYGLLTTTIEVDTNYDIGDRRFFQNNNSLRGAFTEPYNKCYFQIADTLTGQANEKYRYRGYYKFE